MNQTTMDECRGATDRRMEAVFREESGRILASLIGICGSFDLAEEAMQDAFAVAASDWREKGVPANPGAWITAVAHRKIVDAVRRDRTRSEKEPELMYHTVISQCGQRRWRRERHGLS